MTRSEKLRLTLGWALFFLALANNEAGTTYLLVLPMGIVAGLLLLSVRPPNRPPE